MKDLTQQQVDLTAKRKEVHRLRSRLIVSVMLLVILTAAVIALLLS